MGSQPRWHWSLRLGAKDDLGLGEETLCGAPVTPLLLLPSQESLFL